MNPCVHTPGVASARSTPSPAYAEPRPTSSAGNSNSTSLTTSPSAAARHHHRADHSTHRAHPRHTPAQSAARRRCGRPAVHRHHLVAAVHDPDRRPRRGRHPSGHRPRLADQHRHAARPAPHVPSHPAPGPCSPPPSSSAVAPRAQRTTSDCSPAASARLSGSTTSSATPASTSLASGTHTRQRTLAPLVIRRLASRPSPQPTAVPRGRRRGSRFWSKGHGSRRGTAHGRLGRAAAR
jgi:hypothetical protein